MNEQQTQHARNLLLDWARNYAKQHATITGQELEAIVDRVLVAHPTDSSGLRRRMEVMKALAR